MIDNLEALKILNKFRTNEVVVTSFTTDREWKEISNRRELDLSIQVMSKCSSVGLGLALALPWRKVIVLDGDGSLLMNLGCLITVANMAPTNYIHFVIENGVYRTTGGQLIPNSGKTDFVALASAAGYASVHKFEQVDDYAKDLPTILGKTGPVFISVKVLATAVPPKPTSWPKRIDIKSQFMSAVQTK